ncbi:hypothetical protein IW261DRAFT_632465 [Armillaria novae-zelandiae]|uniref:Uncharacterized protein n=1 Tax=Armillaria novae-zelandiae TaxID=153914 RepID=A0AA39PQ81_9AGAR|nr:hypothetical protein IW261DRAFT_632465 [Armillaria novae-zelandiae]
MDPISILTTVISTTSFLLTWIDQHQSKEKAFRDLRATLNDVHNGILLPLSSVGASGSSQLEPNVVGCLRTVQEVLFRTGDHLVVWEDSRKITSGKKLWAFLNPAVVLDELKDDKTQLVSSVQILSASIQISSFIRPPSALSPPVEPSQSLVTDSSNLRMASNRDVKEFWTAEIGPGTSYCSAEFLHAALSRYFNKALTPEAKEILSLRLDEYGVGCTTLASLDRFVGQRPLLNALTALGVIQVNESQRSTIENADPTSIKSILIMVDDEPENHRYTIDLVRSYNVDLFVFTSTASAKTWIDANEAMLRIADKFGRLRCMSDNARWEQDASVSTSSSYQSSRTSLNIYAGETILRYLRGRQYSAPVLISSTSIMKTSYVLDYTQAGSTCHLDVMMDFIHPVIADDSGDEEWWLDFNVQPRARTTPMLLWVRDPGSDSLTISGHSLRTVVVTSFEEAQEEMKKNRRELMCFVPFHPSSDFVAQDLYRRLAKANMLRVLCCETQRSLLPATRNTSTGHALLQYIRSDGYDCPVLVFCRSDDLPRTVYVVKFSNTGSTVYPSVVYAFLRSLSERKQDDYALWAVQGASPVP